MMNLQSFDHIVLCVNDVQHMIRFYEQVLGMQAREERPGKWSLHFGDCKISLQDVVSVPEMAKGTTPSSGNFCMLTQTPMVEIVQHLKNSQVQILEGPAEKLGAIGPILSVYFNDPDGNLIEVSRKI